MRTKSDIINRALELAYPDAAERNAAFFRFISLPPARRDSVRALLRRAFKASEEGRDLPEIPKWLAGAFARRETPVPKAAKETGPMRPMPEFRYSGYMDCVANTVAACSVCGAHPRAEDGLQRVGGRLLCPKCAAARFKAVNKPNPDAADAGI